MKSLLQYINEKLVLGKNVKSGIKNIKDALNVAVSWVNSSFNCDDQIQISSDNNFDDFILPVLKWFFQLDLLHMTPEECKPYRQLIRKNCCGFKIRSLSKLFFNIVYVAEHNLFLIYIKGISKTQAKEFDEIFQKYNFNLTEGEFYQGELMRYWAGEEDWVKTISYNDIINVIEDMLEYVFIRFKLKEVSTIKNKNEILPGWTFEDIKNRYDKIFDDIKLLKTGNIKLGKLKDQSDKFYKGNEFTIYANMDFNNGILIRRKIGFQTSKFVLEPDADKTFDKLDSLLKKRGYNV